MTEPHAGDPPALLIDQTSQARARPRLAAMIRKGVTGPSSVLAAMTIATVFVRMLSSIALTRLLSPHDFGLVGIVNSIFYTVAMLTDLGFQSFVVRHAQADDRHFRDVIWTIHASRGVALAGVCMLGAPLLAWFLQKPDLAAPLAVAALTFALNGFASIALMTSLRTNGANRLSLLDLGLVVFQTVVAIGLAIVWRNVWALIVAMVLQSVGRMILSYGLFANSAHAPARDREISREFLAFSRIVLVSSFLMLIVAQSDKLVLARLLTLPDYGTYAVALNLLAAPAAFVTSYVSRIVYPVYARTFSASPGDLARVYYSARQRISLLYGFAIGGVGGGSALIIRILYDPRYAPAHVYMSLLALGVALALPNLATAELMTAMGRVKVTVRLNLLRVVWLATAAPLGFLYGGPVGLIAAIGLIEILPLLESWRLLHRAGIFSARHEFAYLGVIAAGAAIGATVAWLILPFLPV